MIEFYEWKYKEKEDEEMHRCGSSLRPEGK